MKETVISIEKRRVACGVLVSDTRSCIDKAANAASKCYVFKLRGISVTITLLIYFITITIVI